MILPEYLDTLFVVSEPPASGWPRAFAVVTAANAFSAGSREGDAEADRMLRDDLARMGVTCLRVTGVSPDWRHREHGWAAWPLPLERAVDLGRRHRQNAIFWVEDGTVVVVSCATDERREAGPWEARLRSPTDDPAGAAWDSA